jgi:hypothetical protein
MARPTKSAMVIVSAILVLSTQAQDQTKARKYVDVDWFEIHYVDFRADSESAALDIIHNHFVPADARAGLKPRILEFATGEWDVAFIFPMTNGPAELEWEVEPLAEKWYAALAEREGGQNKAEEILARYRRAIERTSTQVVRERRPPHEAKQPG